MTKTAVAILTILILGIASIFFYAGRNMPLPFDTPSAITTPPVATPAPAPLPAPGAPIVTTKTDVVSSDTIALVAGTVDPNGASTSYWYEYGVSATGANAASSPAQTVGSGYVPLPALASITGLAPNTSYYFRVVAENRFGRASGERRLFQTTVGTPPPVGGAPAARTLAASGISRTGATLNGAVTPHRAPTQFWFEYGKTPSLGQATLLADAGDDENPSAVSLAIAGLEPATAYHFRIDAQNRFGTVNGPTLNFTTTGPAANITPSVATGNASDIAAGGALLHGTVNPNGSATAYWFEYSSDSLFGALLTQASPRTSLGAGMDNLPAAFSISGIARRTTYYFRLVAENGSGTARGARRSFTTR